MTQRGDVAAAHVLYEHENYGNAAYHCQQALEKMIKAAILKDGTLKVAGYKMGHIPFIKIYENRLPADFKKKWKEDPTNYDSNLMYLFLLNTINSDGFLRTLLWKLSLNIPLPELILDNNYYYIPPEYRDPYVISLEPDSKLRLRRFRESSSKSSSPCGLVAVFQHLLRKFKRSFSQSRGEKANPVQFVFTSLYLDQCCLRRRNMKKLYQADDLLGQVLDLLDLYLIVYPHESMGRYSIEVGDLDDRKMGVVSRNTHEWYILQKFELQKLIDEVDRAVTKLDENLIA